MTATASATDRHPTAERRYPLVDVTIVGAGFAGLGMAIRLKRQGVMSFQVLERAADLGGTWRDNTYPGVACDVPSPFYSFSFKPNPDWSTLFAPGQEIQDYLQRCAAEEGLTDHLRFNAPMTDARWDATEKRWTVRSNDDIFESRYLIVAAGHLADWSLPDIPGLADYGGDVFHSAAWRNDVALEGKRVGVIGSGASAIQIVPEVAKIARELVVFQRSPAWVRPRPFMQLTEADRRAFKRSPQELAALRERLYWLLEQNFAARIAIPKFIEEAEANSLAHLERQIADPVLREKLTPHYAIGCKRVLNSNDFYPSLTQPHVHLEPHAAASFTPTGVVSAAGNSFELDAVVFATGFDAVRPHYAELVHSDAGAKLADQWTMGMQAYASTAVNGFPNMFIVNGPNTASGHSSSVFMIEVQIDYIMGALDYARDHQVQALEVKAEAEERYVDEIMSASEHTVFVNGGCHNWFVDPRSGRNTVKWPDFCYRFRDQYSEFSPAEYAAS